MHRNMCFQKPNVCHYIEHYFQIIFVLFLFLGLNKYKKKVYKKTKNLLTGNTEQDEEYQKVLNNDFYCKLFLMIFFILLLES